MQGRGGPPMGMPPPGMPPPGMPMGMMGRGMPPQGMPPPGMPPPGMPPQGARPGMGKCPVSLQYSRNPHKRTYIFRQQPVKGSYFLPLQSIY